MKKIVLSLVLASAVSFAAEETTSTATLSIPKAIGLGLDNYNSSKFETTQNVVRANGSKAKDTAPADSTEFSSVFEAYTTYKINDPIKLKLLLPGEIVYGQESETKFSHLDPSLSAYYKARDLGVGDLTSYVRWYQGLSNSSRDNNKIGSARLDVEYAASAGKWDLVGAQQFNTALKSEKSKTDRYNLDTYLEAVYNLNSQFKAGANYTLAAYRKVRDDKASSFVSEIIPVTLQYTPLSFASTKVFPRVDVAHNSPDNSGEWSGNLEIYLYY